MTEEEVKGLLKEASEKIKDDFIPSMTNLLMGVFQHGLNKGTEIGVKIGVDKRLPSIKWKTGEPKRVGSYLLTLKDGNVAIEKFYPRVDKEFFNEYVVAWCHIRDIEPYKEETK